MRSDGLIYRQKKLIKRLISLLRLMEGMGEGGETEFTLKKI